MVTINMPALTSTELTLFANEKRVSIDAVTDAVKIVISNMLYDINEVYGLVNKCQLFDDDKVMLTVLIEELPSLQEVMAQFSESQWCFKSYFVKTSGISEDDLKKPVSTWYCDIVEAYVYAIVLFTVTGSDDELMDELDLPNHLFYRVTDEVQNIFTQPSYWM